MQYSFHIVFSVSFDWGHNQNNDISGALAIIIISVITVTHVMSSYIEGVLLFVCFLLKTDTHPQHHTHYLISIHIKALTHQKRHVFFFYWSVWLVGIDYHCCNYAMLEGGCFQCTWSLLAFLILSWFLACCGLIWFNFIFFLRVLTQLLPNFV